MRESSFSNIEWFNSSMKELLDLSRNFLLKVMFVLFLVKLIRRQKYDSKQILNAQTFTFHSNISSNSLIKR
jgi:hypothetical protein